VASAPHDAQRRRDAKRALMYSPVVFNGTQAREVARGFADYIASTGRIVHAACVMPDHAHFVIARSDMAIETVAEKLKGRATRFLKEADLHPMRTCGAALRGRLPSPWARGSWSVFLKTPADIRRTIRYVENNPMKAGLKPQRYAWVTPYDA
jgi:REP element-mobilizing transposase RayT